MAKKWIGPNSIKIEKILDWEPVGEFDKPGKRFADGVIIVPVPDKYKTQPNRKARRNGKISI